jgi:hypothetical protein
VYGTDDGAPGNFHWCSNVKPFEPKEVKWAPGEPNSQFHCVYLKNMGGNKSALATADCNSEKKFLCDVRKKQTGGLAMQQECMEIWGVSISLNIEMLIFYPINLRNCVTQLRLTYYRSLASLVQTTPTI